MHESQSTTIAVSKTFKNATLLNIWTLSERYTVEYTKAYVPETTIEPTVHSNYLRQHLILEISVSISLC